MLSGLCINNPHLWEYRIAAIAVDCKSIVGRHRWFESIYSHNCTGSSMDRIPDYGSGDEGSNPSRCTIGFVAQLVEHLTEDQSVGSSILSKSTKNDPPLEREETRDITAEGGSANVWTTEDATQNSP